MLESIENYALEISSVEAVSEVWIGELLEFDRGVVYLTTASQTYKIDFHQSPNYHRIHSSRLAFKGCNKAYPHAINRICNSQLIATIKAKSGEAEHLSLHHFVIASKLAIIEVVTEHEPTISKVEADKQEDTRWKC